MLLTIDVGNTNLTLGAFDGDDLRATWRVATDPYRMADEYRLLLSGLLPLKGVSCEDIDGCALCSVSPPLTPVLEEVCRSLFRVRPLVVGAGTRTGVRIVYDNPRDVGADRVVDAAAAYHMYGGPVIIVDFGTATVFDAVSRQGEYLGGAIAPGVQVASESLVQRAAQLRRVEVARPREAIGRSTASSIQSGLFYGYVGLVEGMVSRFRRELGKEALVVATGGYADLFAQETVAFDRVNVNLTLIGLRLVHQMNLRLERV